ncbi:leucine Rich repeat-containing domain protein [Dictyocaulus viviparus]|uniref:Leucine Rich repeat-containing domain protein n=1 Tax=Dictyocaulus viviparus TaxID=29172 RepID=A0A0D8Y3I4_DICVI|nr:leucine Rich repeat-containing domain protein [Dictyocaulus viviparus]
MCLFLEWPELSVVTQERRLELVLKSVTSERKPPLNDELLQKTVFEKNPQLNFISVAGCGLSFISPSIAACSDLTKLSIIRNALVSLPEEIGTLSQLIHIDLSDNNLECLPKSFVNLTKLEVFVATGNKLTNEGLFDFSAIHGLLVINLSHNELVDVPSTLMRKELVRLHTINLAHNKITEVPSQLSVNEHLKDLNLGENNITDLPWAIGQLEKIRILNLSENPFKDGRFRKLVNDKRAKVSAVIAYISKNAPKPLDKEPPNIVEEELESKISPNDFDTVIKIGIPGMYVKRVESVAQIRPFLSCCVLSNLDLTGKNFKKFIDIQTKLHASSLCCHRTVATIGTHELKAFQPPLKYLALPADDLYITALHKKKPVSARDLLDALARDADLARRRTKRNTLNPLHRYLNLVVDLPVLPCLIDAQGLVISLPPITNSDLTKMSEETQSVWVEVTSNESVATCKKVLHFLS